MTTSEGIVQKANGIWTAEVLAQSDGKTVPLRLQAGGPIVGTATLKYVPEEKALKAEIQTDDAAVLEFFNRNPRCIFG